MFDTISPQGLPRLVKSLAWYHYDPMPVCKRCNKFSNCLTIDPCEHCGAKDWVPPPKITSGQVGKGDFWKEVRKRVVFIAVLLSGFYVYQHWILSEKTRLAQEYKVPESQVIVDPKPHGCDFNDAPLGNKHCHFEKAVDVTRACPCQDCKATAVYVSWRKVEE